MAYDVSDKLNENGFNGSLISAHTLKPLDISKYKEILTNHDHIIVVEEHVYHGGLGQKIKNIAWDNSIDVEIDCFHLQDSFIHCYGSYEEILNAHGINFDKIYNLCLKSYKKN